MRRLSALVLVATAAAALTASSAVATAQAPVKTWLCHKTSGTFTTSTGTFTKYVAIRVSGRAEVRGHVKHGDVRVLPAPTGTLKAQRTAARAFCAALRVPAPVTPTSGGMQLDGKLTGGGVTADLDVRTQVGQRRLCFVLDVTAPAGSTVQLTSLTLTRGSVTVTIGSAQLTAASSSGCVTLPSKADAKTLLTGNVTATLSGTVTPAGGSATPFQATGSVSK